MRQRFSDGLKASERAIMDLWDQGCSVEIISDRLRMNRGHVLDVVSRFHVRPSSDGVKAAIGSEALLAALLRHHPERCAA